MRKISLSILFGLLLYSCSTQAPKEDEVKNVVKLWYEQLNTAAGQNKFEVQGVTVLSIKKDSKRKNVFITTSLINGIDYAGASESRSQKNFSDTLRMDLQWNGAKWITSD